TEKTVVVCSSHQNKWSRVALAVEGNFRQHVARLVAAIIRSPQQRRHTGIAGRHTGAFGRQTVVWGTRAHDDPVGVVTRLVGNAEGTLEGGASLQLQSVATFGIVQSLLQVISCFNVSNASGCRSIGDRTLYR